MNRKILVTVLALALLMLFAAVAPVMASQPKTPYTLGAISFDIPGTGTLFVTADKIEHVRNGEGEAWDFGHPWGAGFSTSTINFNINVDPESNQFLMGSGVESLETTYETGTLELKGPIKFEGLGPFTYHGPTLTATLPVIGPVTVKDGDVFFGLLMTGRAEGRGTFADGNVKISETFSGVSMVGLFSVVSGTGTSMIVGKP